MFHIIDYFFKPYIVKFRVLNDKIEYYCYNHNDIVKVDYFYGINCFYELQYFLTLHNYIYDFDNKKIDIKFYTKKEYDKFVDLLYERINKLKIMNV